MKNYMSLFFTLFVLAGFCFSTFAQTKNIPPSDKDIAYDKEPVVIKQVQPKYPVSMLEGGWEATVYMKAFIDEDGNVVEARSEKIQIIPTKAAEKTDESAEKKVEGKEFEDASYAAVKQWKFTPAQMQGKPVAVWITIPFRFRLSTGKTTLVREADQTDMEKRLRTIGISELLVISFIVLIFRLIVFVPYWRVFGKAGFSPWLSLLTLLPLIHVVMLYYLGFSNWPSLKERKTFV